ncbi:MAG: CPBP family intramembrane glutamic endopeptidase [Bacteroidota bacterium]
MNFGSHLWRLGQRHKITAVLLILLVVGLLVIGILEGKVTKLLVYLGVMALSFLVSEFIYFTGKPAYTSWKIKAPQTEFFVVLITAMVGSGLLIYWFVLADQETVTQTGKTVMMILRLLFLFPIVLLVYFLAVQKYRLGELGLWGFNYWYVALLIIIILGGATFLAFPEGLQFEQEFQNRGIQKMLLLGFLTAAIPEEIARTLLQTRLGRLIHHKSLAWFLVAIFWACQHIPLFSFNAGGDFYGATISALGIVPIGLLWGYLNERYRSIIPSVFIHGTNLWGLQNIF